MSERLQFTFILGGLPLLMVFGFCIEFHEAGLLGYALTVATLLSLIIGGFAWRVGRTMRG